MMYPRLLCLALVGALAQTLSAQTTTATAPAVDEAQLGQTIYLQLASAPYPHASRAEGYKSGDKVYPRDPHYVDNTVASFVPTGYRPQQKTDVLVYFHGHMNEVRKALVSYRLREQIVASRKNVILIFPEGPKNVPDSGCGKMEDPDGLKHLVTETLGELHTRRIIPTEQPGRVVIAGHSGAYRAMSFCVEHGGMDANISDVFLLDSSYGRLDAFIAWASTHSTARLFSIFTDHLAPENCYLMTHLRRSGAKYEFLSDEDVTDNLLGQARILFMHTTKLNHNETVQWLQRWLRSTSLANVETVK